MKTIIFGKRSNLTTSIIKKIKNFEVISSNNIDYDKLKSENFLKRNFIFNNFYPAYKLNYLEPKQYDNFLDSSLTHLVKILSYLNPKKINKIIYTSSSSIYSLDEDLKFTELDKYNRKIYASFKYSAEKIVQNFCQKNNVNFYIMRLFNTYGDNKDKFSFIEKLINLKKERLKLTLINNGISLRDFINVNDVALIYKKFINKKYENGIYDIGTGQGILVKDLVDFVNIDKKKIKKKKSVSESTNSIADLKKLKKNIGTLKFKSLENYLRSRLRISEKKKILSTKFDYSKTKYEGSAIYGAGFAGKKLFA